VPGDDDDDDDDDDDALELSFEKLTRYFKKKKNSAGGAPRRENATTTTTSAMGDDEEEEGTPYTRTTATAATTGATTTGATTTMMPMSVVRKFSDACTTTTMTPVVCGREDETRHGTTDRDLHGGASRSMKRRRRSSMDERRRGSPTTTSTPASFNLFRARSRLGGECSSGGDASVGGRRVKTRVESATAMTPTPTRVGSKGEDEDEEDETPSRWGDMSPGEHGGSQYVMSPDREYSACESDEEFDEPIREALKERKKPEASAATKMFPIFCSGRKQVLLVRHGQSTYNEAIAGPGSWDEPQMYDAALTELGKSQAKGLGIELSKVPKDALWITSPLTRAMETCIIGRRAGLEVKAARMKEKAAMGTPNAQGETVKENIENAANTPDASSGPFDVEKAYQEWTQKLVIRADLTEKLCCTGDIGRPKRSLEKDFPELALAISRIPAERWWWDCEHRPNDAELQQFNSHEPRNHFKARVERFRSWLLRRPEKTFVVFGHSTFFKEFIGGTRSLRNCEIHTMML